MRKTAAAVLGLVSVLVLPATGAYAASGTGPFTGSVAQGETDTHTYDNNPTNNPCIALAVPYTVTLAYAPTSDTLTLSVPGASATGSGGTASLTVTRGVCTEFAITVTGTSVASSATYAVNVVRQLGPAIGGGSVALG